MNNDSPSKFRYKKSLGQNFLHDTVKIARMAEIMSIDKEDTFVEIGPGGGSLTAALLSRAKKVIAVEVDPQAIERLKVKTGSPPNLEIVNMDFLEFDIKSACPKGGKIKIAGNIPYYITAPIIERVIDNREYVDKFWLTVQKEVGERITATHGSKTYGSLSVYCQYYACASYSFTISKKAFFPVPKVDSAFIELDFTKRKDYLVKDEELFFKIVRGGFSQRRKMFINNFCRVLGLSKEAGTELFIKANIEAKARAEELPIEKFALLSNLAGEGV